MCSSSFRSFLVGLAAVAGLAIESAQAGQVQVAVAANFVAPLARLADGFLAATGHTLKVSSGATGKFYAQIVAGAPFDVLLAGDSTTPQKLLAQGHAVAGSSFSYAIGKLVLWSSQPGLVDDQGAVLASGKFVHLALANPKTAPYGAAALEVLQARGLHAALAGKLVTAENIAQAHQFVSTGNAELGFLALSQVVQTAQTGQPGRPVKGSFWLVPATLHAEIRQDAVLLKAGANNPAAVALLAYLRGAAARELIKTYGYGMP